MKKCLIFIYVMLISFSCENNNEEIVLYKCNGLVDRSFDVTESTFWDFKSDGDIDSLKITRESLSELKRIISHLKLKNYTAKPFLNPEYSIVYKTNEVDTFYLNSIVNQGYSMKSEKSFVDENGELLEFFERNKFLTELTKFRKRTE